MSDAHAYSSDVAFTETVKAIQARKGSREAYAHVEQNGGWHTEIDDRLAVAVPVLVTVTVWAALADPTAWLPNDRDAGEAISTGLELFVTDIVTFCTISGVLALVTFSRRSAPPFCASANCAPVSCTVAVVQVPVPGLVTVGPFW